MPGAVTLDIRTIVLATGQEATLLVRIRNLGQVVDGFVVDVLGQPGAWAQVNPPEIRLFPDTEGSIEIKFRQPENAPPVAGSHPFAVRIRSREDPDWVSIEEGTVEVGAEVEIAVELRPRTSSGRSTGKHQVIVDNLGNAPVWVQVVGDDPDDLFRFTVDPPDVELPPRSAAIVDLKARLARKPPSGTNRVPFVVSVLADGRPAATADGGFSPRKLPWKPVLVIAAALVALGVAAYMFTRTNAETQAREGEDTLATTTTTVPVDTTTTVGETTTTAGDDDGGQGGGPLGQRLDEPQVLFASDRDGDFDLLIANLDGSDPVAITDNSEFDGEPAFSPDGTEAVFVRTTNDNADLFRLDLDDCDPADPGTCEPERLTATQEDERFPAFSPDGETVVFSRDTADPSSVESDLDLFMIDLDSGDETQLTSQPGDDSRPQFSPDGALVAFDGVFRGTLGVAVVDLEGGTPQPVSVGRSVGSTAPQWVDEDTLVYVRPAGEAGELVEVDFLTRDPERALFDEPALVLTAISNDGERVVFQSESDLFIAERDGGGAERITDGEGFNFEADLFEPED